MRAVFLGCILLVARTALAAAGDPCDEANIPADINGGVPARMAVNTVVPGGVSISSGVGLVKNARVEVVLPPDWGTFGDRDPGGRFISSATPKRAVVSTGSDCGGASFPLLRADARAGTFIVRMRVSTPLRTLDIEQKVNVFVPSTAVLLGSGNGLPRLVRRGVALDPPISVTVVSPDSYTTPLQGYPVTFTAPAVGATVRFANGTNSITVLSDEFGIARADAVPANQAGTFHVQASASGQTVDAGEFRTGVASTMSLSVPARFRYGDPQGYASLDIAFADLCDSRMEFQLRGGESIRADGYALELSGWLPTCYPNPTQEWHLSASLRDLPFGTYRIEGAYPGSNGIEGSPPAAATVVVEAPYAVATATGRGTMKIGYQDPQFGSSFGTCASATFTAGNAGDPGFPSTPPDAQLPFGMMRAQFAACSWANDWALPAGTMVQRVLVELDEVPAAGTVAWSHGTEAGDPIPRWRPLVTSVKGRQVVFELPMPDPSRAVFALGAPNGPPTPGPFQDLWWAGPGENGWGAYIAQHRDVLFTTLFVYDAQGLPRWLVMPGGQWNADRTAYTGDLYRPKGAPLSGYKPQSFVVGAPVGTATLAFADRDNASLQFVVDGVAGTKSLHRQLFGPPSPLLIPGGVDDMWWGGAGQNGWGFAVAQQNETVFAVLYTYDMDGDTTWLVAPAGARSGAWFLSPLYRTHGSAWLGVPYDESAFGVIGVGTLYLSLSRRSATGSFTMRAPAPFSRYEGFSVERQPF